MTNFTEDRVAVNAAMVAGAVTLLYSAAFVGATFTDSNAWNGVSAFLLMIGGLAVSVVYTGLYVRLRNVHPSLALWTLIVGIVSALGAVIHGGYDLANSVNQPLSDILDKTNYPNAVDPRGLLTFGLAGLAIGGWAWLISQGKKYPVGFVRLSWIFSFLLLVVYLARLTVLEADSSLVVLPAALAGFIAAPLWYFWLARIWQK